MIKEKYIRWLGVIVLGSLMAPIYLEEGEKMNLGQLVLSLSIVGLIWNGDYLLISQFRKRLPSERDTWKRIILCYSIVLLYNTMIDFGICWVKNKEYHWQEFFQNIHINIHITLYLGTLYETVFFYINWKKQLFETEELKNQQLKSRLNVLKNQISPHFLFNSLNTLITLILENPKIAVEFTEKLSEVYRYILQHKEKEIVTLKTELEFTESYNFLLKIRYDKNLNININIDDKYYETYVAPLTLQMLIENAIKHNIISTAKTLTIDVYIQNDNTLIVKNNLQRRKLVKHSTKMGLDNIMQRYSFLSNRNVEVITTKQSFIVALPLVKLAEEKMKVLSA